MPSLEIRRISTSPQGFMDITSTVLGVLQAWSKEELISGYALCTVAVITGGVGLIVTDNAPGGWSLTVWTQVVDRWLSVDLSRVRGWLLRSSESFVVKGRDEKIVVGGVESVVKGVEILGGRRVYVLRHSGSGDCDVAISLP